MSEIIIYTDPNESIQLKVQLEDDTVWLTQAQMVDLFQSSKANISEHIKNIFQSKELNEKATVRDFRTVRKEGKRQVTRNLTHYNLDVIISVGYRVNSKRGIEFRQWATKRLKDYLIKGYAINQKRISENKAQFLQTLDDLKTLSQNNPALDTKDVLSLIQNFSQTWFSLDRYDKNEFPQKGTKEEIQLSAKDLRQDLDQLKQELIKKGGATELFAQEKNKGSLEGVFGSVFQSVFGEDAYPTLEEKAAHLLYFIIKNHPFNDGNKRSGAFAFIWLLQKAGLESIENISPQTLTTLTLLIAQSDPTDKEKVLGIIKLVMND